MQMPFPGPEESAGQGQSYRNQPFRGQPFRGQPSQDKSPSHTNAPITDKVMRQSQKFQDQYYRSLRELERTQLLVSACGWIAWGLLVSDGLFSYWSLQQSSGSQLFAIAIAMAISSVQWVVAKTIYSKATASIFKLDRDEDGSLSIAEIARFALVILAVMTAYVTDFYTNLAGIDQINTGLIIDLPWLPPMPGIMAGMLAFFLMVSDETIHYFAEHLQSDIDRERPKLKIAAAEARAENDFASGVAAELVRQANAAGRADGKTRKIRL